MKLKLPATSANLGPGFDVLGLALDLHNIVEVTSASKTSILISGYGSKSKSFLKNNMFVNIFYEVFKKLKDDNAKFKFEFQNNIPTASGLGSSSSVVVGAIYMAYLICDRQISKEELLNLALEYEHHPDNITPVVYGGFTVSMVENKKVYVQKTDIPDNLQALIIKPDFKVSTSVSRSSLPDSYSMQDTVFNISRASFLASAFMNQDWNHLKLASKDKIHQDIRMKNIPVIQEARELMLNSGALMSTLSGSGPTLFSLVYRDDAKTLYKELSQKFDKSLVKVLDFDNDGITKI